MSLFDTALKYIAKDRGWTPGQADVLRRYAGQVAAVESNCNPTACQVGGGPGRGKYQFELAAGGSGANTVARTRMARFTYRHGAYLRFPLEDDAVLQQDDPDFSRLSEDAQDVIFLANADMHPKFKLDDLVTGKLSFEDAWIRYHWAGPERDEKARRAHWRRLNA